MDSTVSSEKVVSWIPLESNPDIMTEYSRQLGAVGGTWFDVVGFEDSELDTIPKPVVAVMFLFPTNPEYDQSVKKQDAEMEQQRQTGTETGRMDPESGCPDSDDPKLYFMKQTVGGACGAIGLVHALANNTDKISLEDGPLTSLLAQSNELSPALRGQALQNSTKIEQLHHALACSGQTVPPKRGARVGLHFSAFIHKNGGLYELEGCRPYPIRHGTTTADTLIKDAVKICQTRMKTLTSCAAFKKGDEYRFSVLALTTAKD